MSRLIDADALKSKAVPLLFPTKMEPCGHIPVPVNAVVVAEIEQAQTIDAVPVVRCRECKYFKAWGDGCKTCSFWTDQHDMPTDEDAFCSYGERKEGADHD